MPQKFYYLIIFSFLSFAFLSPPTPMQEYTLEKIKSKHLTNFYKLNDSVYRSEQPSKKGMRELEAMGIKSILNLRRRKTDEKKIKGLDLQLKRIPLKAATVDFDDIFTVLNSMQQAKKPVLIHCWHGSDRTGVIIAAHRMVFENWSKDKAIAEFISKPLGHHRIRFHNLVTLLETLDVELLRNKLKQE